MKASMSGLLCFIFAATCPEIAIQFRAQLDLDDEARGVLGGADGQASSGTAVETEIKSLVHLMLHQKEGETEGLQLPQVVNAASKYIHFQDAARAMASKAGIPKEVSAVLARALSNTSSKKTPAPVNDESLDKARTFLNTMVEKAQKELDDKIIEAKDYEAKFKGASADILADIANLGLRIAAEMGKAAEATAGIQDMSAQVDKVRKLRQLEEDTYNIGNLANEAELAVLRADLSVFEFLLKFIRKMCLGYVKPTQTVTAAGSAQLLMQSNGTHAPAHPSLQVCSHDGKTALEFGDRVLQDKFDQLLKKASRDLLDDSLYSMKTLKRSVALLQAIPPPPTPIVVPEGLKPKEPPQTAEEKCSPGGSGDGSGGGPCGGDGGGGGGGVLYDSLALSWGNAKDRIRELQKHMDDENEKWDNLKDEFDAQIASLTGSQDEFVNELSDATKNKNGDQHTSAEKDEQKRNLEEEHKKKIQDIKDRIAQIVQHEICVPTVIRNHIMINATNCSTATIEDCDVTPWSPRACSVHCDETCDPYAATPDCGGNQILSRDILTGPNSCGIQCPALELSRKCNQVKCPSDCIMSEWSGWSKCSKDCEGGIQQRSRAVITKPKFGGRGCLAVSDGRPCNTGSCDRDCTLSDWVPWTECSMSCGGGDQTHTRKVSVPIRGEGKCPKEATPDRYEEQKCNEVECHGDEICIARQDIVITFDGSGSITPDGFNQTKNLADELLKRYKATYWGACDIRVSLVLFGQGHIEDDGTVSKAELVHEMTSEISVVATSVTTLVHPRGFTNMPQALSLAETTLHRECRGNGVQQAILLMSDGKTSFVFETKEKIDELKEKGVHIFILGYSETAESNEWKRMSEFASTPAMSNAIRVPGVDALDVGGVLHFVQQIITKFCPRSISPTNIKAISDRFGFVQVREGGLCGKLGECHSDVFTPEACLVLAKENNAQSFALGTDIQKGQCCLDASAKVSCKPYLTWKFFPEDPQCNEEKDLELSESKYYDWYAVEPPSCVPTPNLIAPTPNVIPDAPTPR